MSCQFRAYRSDVRIGSWSRCGTESHICTGNPGGVGWLRLLLVDFVCSWDRLRCSLMTLFTVPLSRLDSVRLCLVWPRTAVSPFDLTIAHLGHNNQERRYNCKAYPSRGVSSMVRGIEYLSV